MRALAPFSELDERVEGVRKAIRWALRDQSEVARNRWDDMVAGGGLGPATDVRLLLAWGRAVDESSMDRLAPAAEVIETLRIAGDLLGAASGLGGPAIGVLPEGEARFLGEWLVAEALRRVVAGEDLALATAACELARELAEGRQMVGSYRRREEPWSFGPVSLGALHGALEVQYGKPFAMACRLGARVGGAPEHAETLACSFGEAAGLAAGYYLALVEDWDRVVQEREQLRRRLKEDGQRAAQEMQTTLGIVQMQGLGYDLAGWERWAEELRGALDALEEG